jgi:hypothetical protein
MTHIADEIIGETPSGNTIIALDVEYYPYEKDTGYGGGTTFDCFIERRYRDGSSEGLELDYNKLKVENQRQFDDMVERYDG